MQWLGHKNRLGQKGNYMRKKYFGYCKMPMNLQIFAEGDSAGADGSQGTGAGSGDAGAADTGGKDTGTEPPKTFDDILGNKDYQAEFDRRVQKALETQKSKLEVLMDEKATEAEKLAKMTKEEKAQYLYQKKEKELAVKEAAVTKRELMAEAKYTLAEKKLPLSLAEVLTYTDADACKSSIDAVEKAFQEAVEAAVDERLKGGKPPTKAPDSEPITKEIFAKMGYAERLKLKTEQPELYKQFAGK